jgi:hypothetical protein
MKPRTASIIEKICKVVIFLIYLPFAIVGTIIWCFYAPFEAIHKWIDNLVFTIGHKLFLHCDGKEIIKNESYFRIFTAGAFYQWLKNNKNKIENIE